jgi:hypothetical protein
MAECKTLEWGRAMPPQQWRKLIAWCGFSVLLPLVVYLGAFLISMLRGIPGAIVPLLAKGDVLFLGVVLLTVAVNWAVEDLLLTPQTQVGQQTGNYAWLIVTLLVLILTALVYGWILTLSLPDVPPEQVPPPEVLSVVCVGWLSLIVIGCGVQYYRLLSQGRI